GVRALCLARCAAQFGQTGPSRARHGLYDHGSSRRRALAGFGFAAHRPSHALGLSDEQTQEASQLGPTSPAGGCRVGLKLVRIGDGLSSPCDLDDFSTSWYNRQNTNIKNTIIMYKDRIMTRKKEIDTVVSE